MKVCCSLLYVTHLCTRGLVDPESDQQFWLGMFRHQDCQQCSVICTILLQITFNIEWQINLSLYLSVSKTIIDPAKEVTELQCPIRHIPVKSEYIQHRTHHTALTAKTQIVSCLLHFVTREVERFCLLNRQNNIALLNQIINPVRPWFNHKSWQVYVAPSPSYWYPTLFFLNLMNFSVSFFILSYFLSLNSAYLSNRGLPVPLQIYSIFLQFHAFNLIH